MDALIDFNSSILYKVKIDDERMKLKQAAFALIKLFYWPEKKLQESQYVMESIKDLLDDNDETWMVNFARIMICKHQFGEAQSVLFEIVDSKM